ncbi:gamma-butyrobetaine hydroxylase-like domain-containing protein [Rhizobium leguminosarum]|uniref:gamma-butyrobetaine hydroxylase-like domain-containing protein n=1 Tax=Rhizobium leguminosarum TaxID=384 RepID=UPI003F987EE0
MTPLQLKLKPERRTLAITWEDGDISLLPASVLRQRSRAAQAVRALIDGRETSFEDIMVTGIEPIGSYAVRLVFSDGYDRGIYPWQYLREIADSLA